MSEFRIGRKVIDRIHIDSTPKADGRQRSVPFTLAAWETSTQPQIQAGTNNFVTITDIRHNPRTRVSVFHIQPVANAAGIAYVIDATSSDDNILRVNVGKVTNHANFQYDLIAGLGRSEDPLKLHVYDRILNTENNKTAVDRADWDRLLADQPLKQITDPDHPERWNCGAALNQFGASYFDIAHYKNSNTSLYKPFYSKSPQNMMQDIKFDAAKVQKSVGLIRSMLARGIAINVFVVHHDGFSASGGIIQPSGKTHYLTIVGCNAEGSLYLVTDPWPGGSVLTYKSGIMGDVESAFMGILQFTTPENSLFTQSVAFARGRHNYFVLTGPP